MRSTITQIRKSLVVGGAIITVIVLLSMVAVLAEDAPNKKKVPQPAPNQDPYSCVWQKVRPNPKTHSSGTASAVAGLRGEEKGKFLKPYWKGEKKTESPDGVAFREAGKLMDASDFAKAEQAFTSFLTQFPKSPFVPKVKLGLAVCYAKLGKKDDATKVLTQWLTDYPQNEMAPDAKAMLAELKK